MGKPPTRGENFYGVRAISFAPSGAEQVAYGTSDGSIWLWDFTKKTTGRSADTNPAGERSSTASG